MKPTYKILLLACLVVLATACDNPDDGESAFGVFRM